MASGKFSKPRISKKEDQELEQAFRSYLSTLADSALEDPADGIAGVYVIQAYAEKASTVVSGNVYLFKIPFTLVLQF